MNRTLSVLCAGVVALCAYPQSWLPGKANPAEDIRLLSCRYDGSKLKTYEAASADWRTETERKNLPDGEAFEFRFVAQRDMEEAGVAVAFDRYGWTSDNYVMIPSCVYNGNRQRIVNRNYATGLDPSDYNRPDLALTSNPIPQLSPDFGAPSRLEVSVCNAATPAIVFFDRMKKEGVVLLTEQGIVRDGKVIDHAYIIEETPDRSLASFVIGAPGVREKKAEFIGFSPSPDRGITVRRGDEITVRVTRYVFPCSDVPELLSRFMDVRTLVSGNHAPRNFMPMSHVKTLMNQNIEERYYDNGEVAFYRPEGADWMSYGWIGGLMNTFPMLASDDEERRARVASTFNFALPRAKGKSGYYYDILLPDGKVLNRDAAAVVPGVAVTRRNADVLYWMVKQFNLLKRQGHSDFIRADWEMEVRRLADAFVNTWQRQGTWGNYVHVESGDVAVYRTTSGAMAVGALALASEYYSDPTYLRVAREAADAFYRDFAVTGFTSGGCGDILQNSDSETAIALTTSLVTMYEVTGEEAYLQQARHLAALCATWTVSYDYVLPEETPLAKTGANLRGAVWASTQNKHGAPGFCTMSGDALFKIYRATGDTLTAELLRDVIHAHAEAIQTNNKIFERLTFCDANDRGGRGDGQSTGWNETNGSMMAYEIPGIYVRKDKGELYVFDHVTAQVTENNAKRMVLRITNPTAYDAVVTVLAEDAAAAQCPLGDNAFVGWTDKVRVKAGASVRHVIRK